MLLPTRPVDLMAYVTIPPDTEDLEVLISEMVSLVSMHLTPQEICPHLAQRCYLLPSFGFKTTKYECEETCWETAEDTVTPDDLVT